MRRLASLLGILVLPFVVACNSAVPLADGSPSPEALATTVLEAFSRSDRSRLERVALSEREFRDQVWPDLPAARAERNLPFSYVWGDLHQKSNMRLSETLHRMGGKNYKLQKVSFSGITSYPSYVVHRESTFYVTDASGASETLRVCGSFLEKDGAWKVFSYVVDE